ncbi:LLM class flavin-dependent oxidoreductase [Streptomyces sp. NPDC000594]|uniref:LLM class flavin-dependent oxidoreductase n=1 Tax=Streptomyces sp. NPDC000594 TaxID=3154261 RepID=UPI0033246CA7
MSATRPLHLAVALDGPARFDATPYADLARLAERGALDFVTLGDSFTRPGLDALAVLARVAPLTSRIGLVPTVTTTHTDPFQVSTSLATLDWVSQGRAGWAVGVSGTQAEARLFGRHPAPSADALWRQAGETAEVAARLWDGLEDGAGAGGGTGEGADAPRPPQGRPPVVVDLTGAGEPGRRTAARHADVVLLRARTPEEAERRRAAVLRDAAALGRDPADLRVLLSISVDLGEGEPCPAFPRADARARAAARAAHFSGGPVELAELIGGWHRDGAVDGFHLVPLVPARDMERIVNGTVALLQHRSLFRTFLPGGTLREHLGLRRPLDRRPAAAVAGRAR